MTKYKAKPVEIAGQKYRSMLEASRHQVLMILERAGEISDIRREVPFVLAPAIKIGRRQKPALRYYADYVYKDKEGREVVEDVKGMETPVWRIKLHLMATVHGIEVQTVR